MRRNLSLHLKLPGQDYAAEGSTMYILMSENQRYKGRSSKTGTFNFRGIKRDASVAVLYAVVSGVSYY